MYKSISGDTDVALISPGDGVSGVTSIHIANTHASSDVLVDLYISTLSRTSAANPFYLMKGHKIEKGGYIVLDSKAISFNNSLTTGFGLFILLGDSAAQVDVLISK